MSIRVVGAYPIGAVNVSATAAAGIGLDLIVALEASLFGSFGLGSTLFDLQAQFDAALALQLDLGLAISDPTANFQAALAATAALIASIEAALSGSLSINVELNAGISASAALSAALDIRLGGIRAAIEAALAIKGPAVDFFAQFQAALSAGPVVLMTNFDDDPPDTLATLGNQIQAQFSAGVGSGGDTIEPDEQAWVFMMVMKEPSAKLALSGMFLVS